MPITTPARVRNRMHAAAEETDISDEVLKRFIADEQTFVKGVRSENVRGLRSGTEARSICTTRPVRRKHQRLLRTSPCG
jgi:hypothetical protein